MQKQSHTSIVVWLLLFLPGSGFSDNLGLSSVGNSTKTYPISASFIPYEASYRNGVNFKTAIRMKAHGNLILGRRGCEIRGGHVKTTPGNCVLLRFKTKKRGRYLLVFENLDRKASSKVSVYINRNAFETIPRYEGRRGKLTVDLLRLAEGVDIDLCIHDATNDPVAITGKLVQHPVWYSSGHPAPKPVEMGNRKKLEELTFFRVGPPREVSFRSDFAGERGWDFFLATHGKSLGAVPKVWAEERIASSVNLPLMQRLGKERPDMLMLLHFNFRSVRMARFEHADYFSPAHFLYCPGTRTTARITPHDTSIRVRDSSRFKTKTAKNVGKRSRLNPTVEKQLGELAYNDVIVMVDVRPDGSKDWKNAEFAVVKTVKPGIITVSRAHFKTKAGSFAKGAYVAPLLLRSGYRGDDNTPFAYNYSADCPVDENGRNCGDALAQLFRDQFSSGGELERFHGIMSDVWPWSLGDPGNVEIVLNTEADMEKAEEGKRLADTNVDGIPDNGYDRNGVNTFSLGVYDFARKLRQALGPQYLITADGNGPHWTRLTSFLNGIETEGLAWHHDHDVRTWCSNQNIFRFWFENITTPYPFFFIVAKVFLPQNGKYHKIIDLYRRKRLAFATAAILNIAHSKGPCIEISRGVENERYWLGKPVSEIQRPALQANDLLAGAGKSFTPDFIKKWSSEDAEIIRTPAGLTIRGRKQRPGKAFEEMHVLIRNIHIPEGDLFFRFEFKADPFNCYPEDIFRFVTVEVDGRKNIPGKTPLRKFYACANHKKYYEATFYCQSAGPATINIRLKFEGIEPVYIRNFTVHSAQDAQYREFENGLVIANPSDTPFVLDLAKAFPGKTFRKIRGAGKDPTGVCDGKIVHGTITVPPLDGLFLVKIK